MWKILGLVAFCALLTPLQGQTPGIRCSVSSQALSQAVSDLLLRDDLLQNNLKNIQLADIKIAGGLLGLLTQTVRLTLGNVQVSDILTTPLPGIGAEQIINKKLQLVGNVLELLNLVLSITLDTTLRVKYKMVNFVVDNYDIELEECGLQFNSISIGSQGGLLSLSARAVIQDFLNTNLPSLVCSTMKTVINLVKAQVVGASVNVNLPLGIQGSVKLRLAGFPFVFSNYYGIYLNVEILTAANNILSIPVDALPINDPPIQNFKICVGLHPAFLTIAQVALLQLPPFVLQLIPDQLPGATELQNAIKSLFPFQDCGAGPELIPDLINLQLRISIGDGPVCQFASGSPSVSLGLRIEVFTQKNDGSVCAVVDLKDNIIFDAVFSLILAKLKIELGLASHVLQLVSGDNSQLSILEPLIGNLLNNNVVPQLNGLLNLGIPFPQLFGIPLLSVQVGLDSLLLCG